jgi:hypothetical protein
MITTWTYQHTAIFIAVYGILSTWALIAYARRTGR